MILTSIATLTRSDIPVAATGVPHKQSHHAVMMSKFAGKVMKSFDGFIKRAEVSLNRLIVESSVVSSHHFVLLKRTKR